MITAMLLITGCGIFMEEETVRDPFVAEIEAAYPELRGKLAEVDTVASVIDGDTFKLASGDKVRLIGVNTPEVHGVTQYYGTEASNYTKSRLDGKKVVLYKDVSETDRYGRLLRYAFIYGEPVMFNEVLVREGYANAATYPPDVLFADKFRELERKARERSAGLWGKEEPVSASCSNPQIKGNINSRGEKIYHVPGGMYYEQTKAEQMFCTEEEAVAAGFRKSSR